MSVDDERSRYRRLHEIGRNLLTAIGEDVDRVGLRETPDRFARWWLEFTEHDPGTIDTTFEGITVDQVVAVTGVRVWSLCEHHLLPFSCTLAMGYIPAGRVLGLSKFARIAHAAAHRLQVQERLVQDIADGISTTTGSPDVAVVGSGEHLCMSMRGVRTYGVMTTSVMRGVFREEGAARSEFLSLVHRSGG